MSRNPADDEIDGLLLSLGHPSSWRIEQERESRQVALSESYAHLPFDAALRLQQLDSQLAGSPFDGEVDREQLWRARGAILARHEPEHAEIVRQVGGIAASETPIAGPPQQRSVLPPSAPAPASEADLDELYASLRPEHAHHFAHQEAEAVELAEAAAEGPFTASELGLASGIRARYGEQELTPRERLACAEIDRRRADEDYRRELIEARRAANESACFYADIEARNPHLRKRRDRAAGVVLPKSK